MKVTLLSREIIKPSFPTPSDCKIYKLSYIDQMVPPYYVPLILYYHHHEGTNITQPTMTCQLKTALSDTLTHFYPLAGRMTMDHNSVECTDQGVLFSEARVDSCLLDIINCPRIEELNQLVPCNLSGEGSGAIVEQLAIQVNLFNCGGMAVGVCICHRIADACSFSLFLNHWSAVATGETRLASPVFNSASVFPPVDSHEYRRNPRNPTAQPPLEKLVTKRFFFTASALATLKKKVVNNSITPIVPTRVEVVTALIWKCGMAALGNIKASAAFHVVNFRERMAPPFMEHQFGNLFQMATAVTNEITDMASLVGKLRDAFGKLDSEYLQKLVGENGYEAGKSNFKEIGKFMNQEGVGVFRFSSWCRFPVYQIDFGWGRPTWVSSANFNDENCIILMDSASDGGIEAWVVMNEKDMEKFEQNSDLQSFISSFPPLLSY